MRDEQHNTILSAHADVNDIKSLIYVVRGRQVMLDSDLAMLYQVETKRLNESVKRNKARFPEAFCFQLTKEESDSLKSQYATSKTAGRGGRRTLQYCFTEPGIAMLSSVLHSDIAIKVSVRIMNTFVEMRRFLANNALLFEKVNHIELMQAEYQKSTDERLSKVFEYIEKHTEAEQRIFYDGQIYDAFSLITSIIQKAKKEIILIDGYVNIDSLNILSKKRSGVNVIIYTYTNAKITDTDISVFNAQYPRLTVKRTQSFHDRFLVLDQKTAYHIGASIKDAGKKCFGISLWTDPVAINDLITRLLAVNEECRP